jgi:hypothetical protein
MEIDSPRVERTEEIRREQEYGVVGNNRVYDDLQDEYVS